MSTHAAIVTVAVRAPLQVIQVPTVKPFTGEVLVKVEWVASSPLDLHQADSGLLVKHPQVLGDVIAGTVVEVGSNVKRLEVGDKVFGFGWREQKEKAYQEFATFPEILLGKIPNNITPQEAVTVPDNFVTVFHSVTKDLSLPLTWPRSPTAPENASAPILIWGGASSVGQYALQILTYYGYTNLFTTASPQHHQYLKSLGAKVVFDYRSPSISSDILAAVGSEGVPFIFDCIGSKSGSLAPLARIAGKSSKVAVLLPVIVKDGFEIEEPEYSMDAAASAPWVDGAGVRGVRTHFYLENELYSEKLQSEIMPTLLREGIVKPNRYRIFEGKTLVERARAALEALRRKEASGERFVWKVSE